jgi:hypothetical protein
LRLAGAAVADNAHVSNVLGEIALHTDLPVPADPDVKVEIELARSAL